MFSLLGLFQSAVCPDKNQCTRPQCIFSHANLPPPQSFIIPIESPAPSNPLSGRRVQSDASSQSVPAKRASSPLRRVSEPSSLTDEPPRKLLKAGPPHKPLAIPVPSSSSASGPVLRVSAMHSLVPVPVRQTMLKNLYDHFSVLYQAILGKNPSLASEHALKQEEEIYKQSNKSTYRNAIIQCIAAIKRRDIPDSLGHPSVGTEAELAARAASKKAIGSLCLTRDMLESLVLSEADLTRWGYITVLPSGPGGTHPTKEGIAKCDRCNQSFLVKTNPPDEECLYHYGKAFGRKVNGEHLRVFNCCGKSSTESEGCVRGPHVFYESNPEDLHLRHPFSSLKSPLSPESGIDVAALDCEMIYTTGGFRVARVSVVDGSGTEIFDQFVRMDDGVQVIDYNTRFSGVTQELLDKALLPLASIRQSLDAFINSNTILIGHALDNDLKALRIIHHRCIDTAILFPHQAGPPYRRALRDLVREHLHISIQRGGGTVGHSSVEDSIATLDLVKWYILNKANISKDT